MGQNDMYSGSDSGVTRCCRCRYQPNWGCTVCSACFTRKQNAERHVKNVHSGEGGIQILGNRQNSSELKSPSLINSQSDQSNSFLPGRKARQLLDEQSANELERIISIVNQHGVFPFLNLAGRVCKDCLGIVLEGEITTITQTTFIPRHKCKLTSLFDQPFLLNNGHLAEKYQEDKIGGILLNILCRHNQKFVSVDAKELYPFTTNKQNQIIADY